MNNRIPDRLLRFTLHTTDDVDPSKLKACVDQALGKIALDSLPELLRTDKRLGRSRQARTAPRSLRSEKARHGIQDAALLGR